MTHPEELLAEYVDGSLGQDERAVVDAHLEGCDQCRAEVAAAHRARGALIALPEVELPEGFRADRRVGRVRPAGVRHDRLRRTAVAAGAVAASIAAIVGVAVLFGHGGANYSAAPEARSGGGSGVPAASGTTYTAASVNALADSLVTSSKEANLSRQPTAATPGHGTHGDAAAGIASPPVPPGADYQKSHPQSLRIRAACVRKAAHLPSGRRIQPNVVGTFDGTPAYIAAYRVDGSIRVVVVSRSNCSVLYSTSRPIP